MKNSLKINNYIITNKRIGKGSSATVYLGYDTVNKLEVAVKKFELLDDDEKLQRKVLREIYILKNLNHPNIVKMYDYYYDNENNNMYLFLEYCSRGSINYFLGKGGYLDEKYANKLMKQFISAIKYLYSNNYYHRDIKPDNILLTKDYTLKITDFGMSTKNTKGNFYRLCGSPLYMAPEILVSSEYNKLSDIWSIGLVAFQLLYGYHPYYNIINIIELITKYRDNNNIIIPPYKKPDDVKLSKECIHFLRKMLQIKINKRITWEQLFIHPWLKNDFETFTFITDNFMETDSSDNNDDKDIKNKKLDFTKDNNIEITKEVTKEVSKEVTTEISKKISKEVIDSNTKNFDTKNLIENTTANININKIKKIVKEFYKKEEIQLPWKYNKLKNNNEFYKLNYNLNLKNSKFYSTLIFKKYNFINTFDISPKKALSSSKISLSFPSFVPVR
jgi:serine/threonine protein kinase